jgi:nitrogen regulatory protein PII
VKLYHVKLLTITCEILAQKNVIDILHKHHISGYTFYEVGGSGTKGIRGQGFQSEKNIKIEVILQEEKLSDILEEIARTLFSDYAIITYVSDVGVIRMEKFS